MPSGFSFAQVPTADIPRSSFNRSHSHKTTFDSGNLVPFYVDEALPGDTFNLRASIFARLATPLFPILDNMKLDVFFFAVPFRLVWDNFQRFMGEQPNPGDSTDFLVPEVIAGAEGFAALDLFDYFGLPVGVADLHASALFSRAYNLVYNEWFRDENLQDRVPVPKDDGPDSPDDFILRRRGKRHDYFTSCLPWPQKGVSAELPLGASAPLTGNAEVFAINNPTFVHSGGSFPLTITAASSPNIVGLGTGVDQALGWNDIGIQIGAGTMAADLTNATASTINQLREAFQIQRLLERDARGGTRYTEILRSHFGVVSPDQRLQRPEYLGGGSIDVVVNPVTQTSSTDTVSPQGNLAAYGVAGGSGLGFSKSFTEHTVLLGLISARADLSYQQGMHRMFSRRTRYDFYWPAFAHLGEQAVLSKEIYCDGSAADENVFGYQERWAEYRYLPSKITGQMRSSYAIPLDSWHLGQKFLTRPTLSASFITENPPVDRVIATPSEPHFLFDSHISIQAARPMPTYSVPGMIDRF